MNNQIKYITLLRGINVGGKRMIKMELLKKLFEEMGFEDVITYINSGNIIFKASEKNSDKVVQIIESHLLIRLGYDVQVCVRTLEEMVDIVKNNPFSGLTLDKKTVEYVTFLSSKASKEQKETLESLSCETDVIKVIDREIYIVSFKEKGESILLKSVIEKNTKGLTATNRNWNTVMKLIELSNG
jgi:uncharacterized protein (DUF1697 family)